MADRFDIVVLGGGPAGSIAARGLALLGHRVAMLTRPRRFPSVEGLSAKTVEGLRAAGFAAAVEVLGPEVPRQAIWNGATGAANRERVADRAVFDAAFMDPVLESGVRIYAARIGAVRGDDSGVRVRVWPSKDGFTDIAAKIAVEARGRQAPKLGCRRIAGPATVALSRPWRRRGDAPAMTGVASFGDGWAWFAAARGGPAVLQIFVSAKKGEVPARNALGAYYDDLLTRIPEARPWLEGASPAGPVSARNAGAVLADPVIDGRLVRIGDAAMAIDPLSGHGVFEAIGSAGAAIPVINTLIRRPGDGTLAGEFHGHRAKSRFFAGGRTGRDFYALEQRWPERPFWRDRRAWPDNAPAHPPPLSQPAEIAPRAVVSDGFIELAEVVVTADHPRGVWRIAGVALVPLLRFMDEEQGSVEAAARHFEESPENVQMARDWLRGRSLVG